MLLTQACPTMIKHLLCSIFTALLIPYYPLELKMLFMATYRDREEQESAAASRPPSPENTFRVEWAHVRTVQWVQPPPMKELNRAASRSSTVDVLADKPLW